MQPTPVFLPGESHGQRSLVVGGGVGGGGSQKVGHDLATKQQQSTGWPIDLYFFQFQYSFTRKVFPIQDLSGAYSNGFQ